MDKKNPKLPSPPVFPMRINKYLAWKKHSTRRGADELISKGQVLVNGRTGVLGDKVQERDRVEVRFRGREKPHAYIAYHKPRGIVTHSAEHGTKEIKDVVKIPGVFPVGRLDKDSSGLIILTDDGRITERLLGPEHYHEKEYLVTTKNRLRSNFKDKVAAGVKIEGEKARPAQVAVIDDHTFRIILTEGKKHEIRRIASALFQEVDTLERVRIMNIELGDLPSGSFRTIKGEELKAFLELLGLGN